MKGRRISLLLLLVMLCMKSCMAQNAGYVLGNKVSNTILPSQGGEHFLQAKIDNPKTDQYLFFNLQIGKEHRWQRVKLTVKQSSNPNKDLLVCQQSGSEVCFMKGSQLHKNDNLIIDIQCQDRCNYQFETYWKQMTELTDGNLQYLKSSKGQIAELFFFNTAHIPIATTEIRMILLQSNKMSLFNAAKIYVNTNNSFPTEKQHQFESILLGNGNQGIFLSRKLFADKNLTILILKEEDTSYSLMLQTRKPEFRELLLDEQQDDFAAHSLPENRYMVDFEAIPGQKLEDIFNIQMNLYKGKIEISFYKDSDMLQHLKIDKKICSQTCRFSMKGRELFQQEKIKKLYITISSIETENVYSISLKRQNNYGYHELKEQTQQYFKVTGNQIVFAKFSDNNFTSPKVLPLDFYFGGQQQKYTLVFSICFESSIKDCTGDHKQTLTQSLSPSIITKNEKTFYRLELKKSHYNYLTKAKDQGIILIEFKTQINLLKSQSSTGYFVMNYENLNSIVNLQNFETLEDEIRKGEIKYYHYFNQKAEEAYDVEFNFKLLTGYADLYMVDEDPRTSMNVEKVKVQSTHMVNYKPKKDIYFAIQGKTSSIYMFDIKTVTKQQHKQQQIQKQQKQTVQVIQFKQNYEEYIILKPMESINFIIRGQKQAQIFYEASSSVGICYRQKNSAKCQNSTLLARGNKNKFIMKAKEGQNNINGKIMSLRDDWTVQVRVTYYSNSLELYKCMKKTVGKLYNDIFEQDTCFEFEIKEDANLKAILVSNERVPFKVQANLCGKELQIKQSIFSINRALINYNCFQKAQKILRIKTIPTSQDSKVMKMTYILQGDSKPLLLPDGIGFADSDVSHGGELKRFYYKALNLDDIEIMIHCKLSLVRAFVKIVEETQITTAKIGPNSFDFSTESDTFYDVSPRVIVTKEKLTESKCKNCVIVISVWADKQTPMASSISYIIEATQGNTLLMQNEPYRTFIEKNSVLYFRYECQSNQRQLYFLASDNDQQTVKIYMNDEQYPNQNKNIKAVFGNQLSIKCEKDNYYFAVEAIESSIVTVVIETSLKEIRRLIPGVPVQTSLQFNQPLFFTFTHTGSRGFKIFALNELGDLKIKVIKSTEQILQKITVGEELKVVEELSKQNSSIGNLYVSTKDQLYCANCSYIGILETDCKNITNVSLILYENKEQLVMVPQNLFTDILSKDDRIDLEYYLTLKGQIQVSVYSGQIQISLQYDGNSKSVTYNNQTPQNTTFNFLDPTLNYDWQPLYIGIVNKKQTNANYSLKVYRDNEELGKYYIIKNNQKKILVIVPDDIFCIRGNISSNREKLFLILSEGQTQLLEHVDIKLAVDGQKVGYRKQQVHQSIQLIIQDQIQKQSAYSMCMINSNPKAITFMVLQSNSVSLMKVDQENYINKQTILLVNLEQKQAMFDILTCKGEVNYTLTDTFDQMIDGNRPATFLDSVQLRQMEQNQQNHVVYKNFEHKVGYLKVYGSDAMVRAYSIDSQRRTGMGYKDYEVGQVSYEALDDEFKIIWQSIHQISNANSKLKQINFRIILAQTQQDIKTAANCGKYNDTTTYILQQKIMGQENCHAIQEQTINSKIIKKSDIKDNFQDIKEMHISGGSFLYVTVTADFKVGIQLANDTVIMEEYRMTYPCIEIPRDLVLMEGHTTQKYRLVMAFTFALIAVAILSFIAILYILLKKVIPIISRAKNRMLLTEQRANTSKNSMDEQPDITTTHKGITPDINV